MVILDENLSQSLIQAFGEKFAEANRCVQTLELSSGRLFWSANEAQAGIYLVLTGKVQLLDSKNRLIGTLGVGKSFGEMTLFPDNAFQPYTARASVNLKLAYFPGKAIEPLILKYPSVCDRLYQNAIRQNLLLAEPSLDSVTPKVTPLPELPLIESPRSEIHKAYFPSLTTRVSHLWQRLTRRYPFSAQQSASDCGAACLIMVGRYWGKQLSVNHMRELANIDRNDSSLRGLAIAAESIGFSTRPVKAELKRLARQPLPAIAHWQGKHYIVVYKITCKQVLICDPAIGQRTLTPSEFNDGWAGYTLLLQPTAFFNRNSPNPS